MKYSLLFFGIICFVIFNNADGQVPQRISYQGLLTTSGGAPLTDGAYNFQFDLYDSLSGGTSQWSEIQNGDTVKRGTFSVILGSVTPMNIPFTRTLYLQVKATAGPAGPSYPLTFSPRSELTSAPYAIHARVADSLAGGVSGSFLPLAGGQMSGAITNAGNPAITMGKGNFGSGNINPGTLASVAGSNNRARGAYSTVSGGGGPTPADSNSALGDYSSVGGGTGNIASGAYGAVGGGVSNLVIGPGSTIGGGQANEANGRLATVGGGEINSAGGLYATVPGGYGNEALGSCSFAAGQQAVASRNGTFVWADSENAYFFATGVNQFLVRASGGVGIGTNSPSQPLQVHGVIYSDSGGFKFPDGTVQTSAGAGGNFLALSGGQMTGGITNTGDPPITMGKGNFGSLSTNAGTQAFVAGYNNTASGQYATVGGGQYNTASGPSTAIGGGEVNIASIGYSTIAGGANNSTSNQGATVGGGIYNKARGAYSVVSGGGGATAADSNSAIGDNTTIGGGTRNIASDYLATVGGGSTNTASNSLATIGGGLNNTASNSYSTISGGTGNTASGIAATIAGGGGNTASGRYSFVPGGAGNTAAGSFSFAAGQRAKANHNGTFVWADSENANFASSGDNQFLIRASGGVGIGTNSPASYLHVQASDATGNGVQAIVSNTSTSGNSYALLTMQAKNGDIIALSSADGLGTGPLGTESAYFGTYTSHPIGFVTGNTERMRITTSGSIGIGTTIPGGRLDVRGNIKLGTSGELFAPGGEENLRMIRGTVDSTGTIVAGSGFTASKFETGGYLITFTNSFSSVPSITVTCQGSLGEIYIGASVFGAPDNSSFEVTTYKTSNSSLTNLPFSFIAVGPR